MIPAWWLLVAMVVFGGLGVLVSALCNMAGDAPPSDIEPPEPAYGTDPLNDIHTII